MSETPENNGGAPNGGPVDPNNAPSLSVLAQYLKDLSFENPRAPASYQSNAAPQIEVNIDIKARNLAGDQFEVELSVVANARRESEPVFVVEATYAGVFQLRNLPQDQIEPITMVECPRLLFPYLRQVVSDATRNGNYPPLLIDPIDFFALYMQNAQRSGQRAEGVA